MLEKTRSEHPWIEPTNLDDRSGETASQQTTITEKRVREGRVREERLQTREGKSCSRTVKQALAISHLKGRKAGEY